VSADNAADFIRRLTNLLEFEDVFGYSLQKGASGSHGSAEPTSGHSVRVRLDGGDIIVTARPAGGAGLPCPECGALPPTEESDL
jgi:hypothetical protein